MSKVSTIHAAYLTRLAAVLPAGFTRLPNPYKPEENPSLLLKMGFGLRVGTGINTNRMVGCRRTFRRNFVVVITREYLALDTDADAKATTEKQILEDALLIQRDIENDGSLGGSAVVSAFIADSGIEYVSTATDRFMKTEIQFESEYFENLT